MSNTHSGKVKTKDTGHVEEGPQKHQKPLNVPTGLQTPSKHWEKVGHSKIKVENAESGLGLLEKSPWKG